MSEGTLIDVDLRGTVADLVKLNVRQLLIDMLSDEEMHAECVAAGPFRFREAFNKDMAAFYKNNRGGCDNLANAVYHQIAADWDARHPHINARQWLDRYMPVSALTEQEIEDAWEIEIGSSDTAMKSMYEGSCRIRKGRDLGERNRG